MTLIIIHNHTAGQIFTLTSGGFFFYTNGENQTHIGGNFDFKDTVEIGGGYKSIGYSNVLLVVKTKFGLTAAYAYDFGIPSGQSAVTRSGNDIFLKFKF